MSLETRPQPARSLTGGDADHWYCCDPTVAYCGLDISGVREGREFQQMCPLCVLADEQGGYCPEGTP